MCKTYLIDMDNTLTVETCWTDEEVINATPKWEMVDKVNQVARSGNYVIIYTARMDELLVPTLRWLRKHNIKFHAISNNKVPGIYVDDRAISFEEFLSI
jgi:uncharacterized HAD superfamily protein